MTDLTDADLDALEALANAATSGPWKWDGRDLWGPSELVIMEDYVESRQEDYAFIAASREALPRLVAEVRRLRALVADVSDYVGREWYYASPDLEERVRAVIGRDPNTVRRDHEWPKDAQGERE